MSTARTLNNTDLKKWVINTIKYLLWVALMALVVYLKDALSNNNFDFNNLIVAVAGALTTSVIDLLHRYINDNSKPL